MTTNRNLATTAQTHVAPGWQRTIDDAGRAQYLPAVQPQRRQMPMLGEVLPSAPTEPANLVHAWQQPVEAMLEHTSANDRAKGVVRRSMPMLGLVALLALAGALVAWGVAGTVPSVLTFLVIMAMVGGGLYLWESRTEYQHSRGGIERLRIVESANLEMAKIDGEIELRRLALDAYIRMMEKDDE